MKQIAAAVVLLAACAGWAQEAASPKPATLMQGLSSLHHPVSTTNSEAQQFFDQGLRLVYAFNHEEAARSFRRAAELDPKLAMAWWGIALAVGPNYNLPVDPEREKIAVDAIDKAKALGSGAPLIEKDYIEAMAKRYSHDAKPNYHQLNVDYSSAMRELTRKYPDDLDAATLFADSMMNLRPWKLWNPDGTPAEGTNEIVATLEAFCAAIRTISGQCIFTFMRWKPHPTRSGRCRMQTELPHWLRRPATWCTCLPTSTSAQEISTGRASTMPLPPKPMKTMPRPPARRACT